MSSITRLVCQPIINDTMRLGLGTAKTLTGGLLAMGPIHMNQEQSEVASSLLMSGTKDIVSSSFGFASRLTSVLGQGSCMLLDGLSKGLSLAGQGVGLVGDVAESVLPSVIGTPLSMLTSDVNTLAQGGSKLLDFTSGVVDSVTGHPVKAYDVYMGNVGKGVSDESIERTQEALDNFYDDDSVPEPVKTFVRDLMSLHGSSNLDEDSFATEVLSGAHVVVEDGGSRYEDWSSDGDLGAHDRSSSHYSDGKGLMAKLNGTGRDPLHTGDQQRGFDIPGLGHILFGTCKTGPDSDEVNTWFQFEAHGTSARDVVPHTMDWVVHKASGNSQVGPLGYSTRSEKTGSQITVSPGD